MDTIKRHGLAIGIERISDDFYLTLKATGKLTHNDYKTIVPLIESALSEIQSPQIKALFDATEFEGWELRAAWDDLKLGMKHGNKFTKIAIVGHQKLLDFGAKISTWFMSGEVKHFDDKTAAWYWLRED